MCDPMTLAIASFGIGAAQSIASYGQQKQQAERQNQYYQDNAAAANKALVNTYAGQQNQQLQERNASSQKLFEGQIKAAEGRATAVTSAGEAGVSGLSVDALLGDFYARESRNKDAIDSNYQMTRDGIRANMEGAQAQGQSRINSVQQAVAPSFGDALLRIAGSGVSAAGTYYNMQNRAKMSNYSGVGGLQ